MTTTVHESTGAAIERVNLELSDDLLRQADLEENINRLREELQKEQDRYLRLLADFKNYRRHADAEGTKAAQEAGRDILLPLLNVMDDIERFLKWESPEERALEGGVRSIYYELRALLERKGVHPFDSVGEMFTPELHDAVAVAGDAHARPGTVLEELRRGYLWNGGLLRPAQVRVAQEEHEDPSTAAHRGGISSGPRKVFSREPYND